MVCVFFFTLNPEGKKTRKYPPTYLFLRTTVTFICYNKKKKKLYPFARGTVLNLYADYTIYCIRWITFNLANWIEHKKLVLFRYLPLDKTLFFKLGFCAKKNLLIFCLTETNLKVVPPPLDLEICLTMTKNEQMFYLWFFHQIFGKFYFLT